MWTIRRIARKLRAGRGLTSESINLFAVSFHPLTGALVPTDLCTALLMHAWRFRVFVRFSVMFSLSFCVFVSSEPDGIHRKFVLFYI